MMLQRSFMMRTASLRQRPLPLRGMPRSFSSSLLLLPRSPTMSMLSCSLSPQHTVMQQRQPQQQQQQQRRGFALSRSDTFVNKLWTELLQIGEDQLQRLRTSNFEDDVKDFPGTNYEHSKHANFSYPRVLYPHHSVTPQEIIFFMNKLTDVTVIEPPKRGRALLDFDNTRPSDVYKRDIGRVRQWHHPPLEIRSVPFALFRGEPEAYDIVFDRSFWLYPAIFRTPITKAYLKSKTGKTAEVPSVEHLHMTTMLGHCLKIGGIVFTELDFQQAVAAIHHKEASMTAAYVDRMLIHTLLPQHKALRVAVAGEKYSPDVMRAIGYGLLNLIKVYPPEAFRLVKVHVSTRKRFKYSGSVAGEKEFYDVPVSVEFTFIKFASTLGANTIARMKREERDLEEWRRKIKSGKGVSLDEFLEEDEDPGELFGM